MQTDANYQTNKEITIDLVIVPFVERWFQFAVDVYEILLAVCGYLNAFIRINFSNAVSKIIEGGPSRTVNSRIIQIYSVCL
jgi:hypothetical protein